MERFIKIINHEKGRRLIIHIQSQQGDMRGIGIGIDQKSIRPINIISISFNKTLLLIRWEVQLRQEDYSFDGPLTRSLKRKKYWKYAWYSASIDEEIKQ